MRRWHYMLELLSSEYRSGWSGWLDNYAVDCERVCCRTGSSRRRHSLLYLESEMSRADRNLSGGNLKPRTGVNGELLGGQSNWLRCHITWHRTGHDDRFSRLCP